MNTPDQIQEFLAAHPEIRPHVRDRPDGGHDLDGTATKAFYAWRANAYPSTAPAGGWAQVHGILTTIGGQHPDQADRTIDDMRREVARVERLQTDQRGDATS